MSLAHWQSNERLAKRAIEDRGFIVHDANVLFGANCPNIDLVIYGQQRAVYVQVKSSQKPAGSDHVIIDGSPWTSDQLHASAPIFNRHNHFCCSHVVIVDTLKTGETEFYVAPPEPLEALLRKSAREFAARPKRDGTLRSIRFRKELPRSSLKEWRRAWSLLGIPLHAVTTND